MLLDKKKVINNNGVDCFQRYNLVYAMSTSRLLKFFKKGTLTYLK
jgi:hypothetical protein